jgi:hypothetical protein
MMNSREMPPQKRVRGGKANGILKTARSVTRTRHKPTSRIPNTRMNSGPKEAGRGTERHATPNSQGIHHQSLLGPSLQQGWAVEAADGQLIWIEGGVEDVMQGIDSTVPRQQQEEEEYFEIPNDFETGYKALLLATQADRARGAVLEIKCRLCPKAKFKTWAQFKRHCDSVETHPLTIYFCKYCGQHFARSDSRDRHSETWPSGCPQATSEEADAKCRETQRVHEAFTGKLKGYLTRSVGEVDIMTPFWKTIKDKYPKSSKKRVRRSGE